MKIALDDSVGFAWDEGNSDNSLIQHRVADWECEQVFFNEPLLVRSDPQHSIREKQSAAFGMTDAGRFLVVIYTKRRQLIRVISARAMTRKERRYFEENA